MATYSTRFQQALAVFFGLAVFGAVPAQASLVTASSDMSVNNLSFVLDANTQLQWTDVWQGIVSAHAADPDSPLADQSNSILGNNAAIQAVANSADVNSSALYSVASGDQIGLSAGAAVSGATHSGLTLAGAFKQADGFAESTFNDFFMLTNPNDPTAQGPVNVTFNLNYSGSIFGSADFQGVYQNITDIATLQLFDPFGNSLNDAVFQNSISGTGTTQLTPNQGTLSVSLPLNYNTVYLISATADAEIYGYTITGPATLPLILLGLLAMQPWRKRLRR